MSREEFWRQTVGWLLLGGRVHWVFQAPTSGGGLTVMPVGAVQMEPQVADDGTLIGWTYKPAGSRQQRIPLPPEQVWTIRVPTYDPTNPYGGVAAADVARRAINQVYKSDLANEASLDNGVEPSGVFTGDGQLSDQQLREFRSQVEARYGGVENRRRPLYLFGSNIKWQQTAATFADMEFSLLQKMKISDVCIAIGIDPAAIGYVEGGRYEFVKSSKAAAWIDRIIPLAAMLAAQFERGVLARMNDRDSLSAGNAVLSARKLTGRRRHALGRQRALQGRRHADRSLYAWFDDSAVPAVQESRLAMATQAKSWLDIGVPLNDVIAAFDLPFEERTWGNTWWKPFGLSDVQNENATPGGLLVEPPGPPAPEVSDEDDAADDGDSRGDMEPLGQAIDRATETQLAGIRDAWRASWAPLEKRLLGVLGKHHMELRAHVLRQVATWGPAAGNASKAAGGIVRRDTVAAMLFDLVVSNNALLVRARPLIRAAVQLGGEQAIREAAPGNSESPAASAFNLRDPEALAAMRRREIRLSDTNRTLRNQIRDSLTDGLAKGENPKELADRVRGVFNVAGPRASTIARTEVGAAVEEARHVGRTQAGVPLKSWLWSRKETGRPGHAKLERDTLTNPIPNDQPFTSPTTGATAMNPRSFGRPDEDINCGCTTIGRYPGDQLKSVLGRLVQRGFLRADELGRHAQEVER
jgi:hypothetical protein